jgi:hypothetical protein
MTHTFVILVFREGIKPSPCFSGGHKALPYIWPKR